MLPLSHWDSVSIRFINLKKYIHNKNLLKVLVCSAVLASLLGSFEVALPHFFFAQKEKKGKRKLEPNNSNDDDDSKLECYVLTYISRSVKVTQK